MKKELIIELFNRFESACQKKEGVEFWSARELQELFGYTQWRNFVNIIDKAKLSCTNAGEQVKHHFAAFNIKVEIGSISQREIDDIALTRYACYLIAQNGDPTKAEIAFAQTYFAVQTRKQEIIEQRILDVERVAAREKLSKSEKKLSRIIFERKVSDKGFGNIRSKGDQALFGGYSTVKMKVKLGVPPNRPLADFLATLILKGKDFATELTSHNVLEKDLEGEVEITKEHVENNIGVRKILGERGVKPEKLPAAEDVNKIKRKLAASEAKVGHFKN